MIVPPMFGCSRQKYGYSPASVKVKSNVAAGAIMPESNLPSGVTASPDVAVCGCASSFVHVTVVPVLTSTGFGSYASVVRLEEPGTMETPVGPPVAPVSVAPVSAASPVSVALVSVSLTNGKVSPSTASVSVTLASGASVSVSLITGKVSPSGTSASVTLASGTSASVTFAIAGGPLTMGLPLGGTIVPAG